MDLQILVDNQNYILNESKDGIHVNGKKIEYDYHKVGDNSFLIFHQHKSYKIEIVNQNGKTLDLRINGKAVEIQIKNHLDQLLEKLGMTSEADDVIHEIISPMPGTILEIFVQEGDTIKKGDPLLVLEAMKMENIIKSPVDNTVRKIEVEIGENVNKAQSLIGF